MSLLLIKHWTSSLSIIPNSPQRANPFSTPFPLVRSLLLPNLLSSIESQHCYLIPPCVFLICLLLVISILLFILLYSVHISFLSSALRAFFLTCRKSLSILSNLHEGKEDAKDIVELLTNQSVHITAIEGL